MSKYIKGATTSELGVYLEPVGDDTTNPFPSPTEHQAKLEEENQELRELFVYFFGVNYEELAGVE